MTLLRVSYDPADPRAWTLEAPVAVETSIGPVEVPAGFIWDFASVPRPLRSFVSPLAYYGLPSLIHDHLYSQRRVRRKTADRVFRELLRADGIGPLLAWVMWLAVRLGGWRHWGR